MFSVLTFVNGKKARRKVCIHSQGCTCHKISESVLPTLLTVTNVKAKQQVLGDREVDQQLRALATLLAGPKFGS